MLGVARSLAPGTCPLLGGQHFHAQNGNAPSALAAGALPFGRLEGPDHRVRALCPHSKSDSGCQRQRL